jgi:hypothetical protein
MDSQRETPRVSPPIPTSLASLADLSGRLEQTKSRLELMHLVGDFLRALPPADLPAAARFLVGQPFPEGDPRKLDVSGATLWRAACTVAAPSVPIETLWKTVDLCNIRRLVRGDCDLAGKRGKGFGGTGPHPGRDGPLFRRAGSATRAGGAPGAGDTSHAPPRTCLAGRGQVFGEVYSG